MLKIAWHPEYAHPLPDGHRFPMIKYELLPEQLIHEGTISEANLFSPNVLEESQIIQTHTSEYWNKLSQLKLSRQEERKTGFPLSRELVNRECRIMQGTIECAEFALEYGVSINIAGGTHHAYTNRGEGFCLLNDIALSANHLILHHGIKKVLVVDLDVHQGNGTAEIFQNNAQVFTFSMHGEKNYPMHKEQSDLDIGLPDGIEDEAYLGLLDRHLKQTMDLVEPDFVFFQSGVDVLATDKLGRLGMSIQGCKERDRKVLDTCYKNNIPVACAMGGGYSEDIRLIVDAHANTYRLAQEIFF